MEIRYVLADPSGNTTLFIPDPYPRRDYPKIAGALLAATGAEQVAFIKPPTLPGAARRMEMAGGEFCGNATRSFGAWLAMGGHEGPLAPSPDTVHIPVEVSGQRGPLTVHVTPEDGPGLCTAAVDMPEPTAITHGTEAALGRYSLVTFPGIVHLVLWEREGNQALLSPARALMARHGCPDDCFGIMFTDLAGGRMAPLVYVKAVDSLIWESSCGTGTTAVACALAHENGADIPQFQLKQPGGTLQAQANSGGRRPQLTGPVVLYPEKMIDIMLT